jgi:AcrR family transcriptional regulator
VSTRKAAAAGARDVETRDRLLDVASRLFAENGFARVTVRDICREAHANVAAINYHFGGKLELYDAVVQNAVGAMQATTQEAQRLGDNQPPEAQLRAYIAVFVSRLAAGGDSRIHQLMMREMSEPTPAFDRIVDQVILPRLAYLASIVARLLDCSPTDPRVLPCVFSIHAQCIATMHRPGAVRIATSFAQPTPLHDIVGHITRFSIAGIRGVAGAGDSELRIQNPATKRAVK